MLKNLGSVLLLLFLFVFNNLFSQEYQRIKVKHSRVFIACDTIINVKEDTVILLPEGQDYLIQRDKGLRTERFYHKLKCKAYNNNWSKLLYDILTTEDDSTNKHVSQNVEDFLPYEGSRIDNIYFKPVQVWSGSVVDTSKTSDNAFTKFSNSTHVGTREKVLRNNLFFTEGDSAHAYTLADNERILRQLPYIEDARIYVNKKVDGNIDLTIVTKDLYSYGFRLDMHGLDTYDWRIFDRNFLGYGNTFSNAFVTKSTGNPQYGYEGFLAHNNIRGSFVNMELIYRNAYDKVYTGALVERQFIVPSIKYGGAVQTIYIDSRDSLYRGTDSLTFVPYRRGNNNVWLGRSFKLGRSYIDRNNITLLASLDEVNFFDRPIVSKNSNILYHEELALISSVLFSHRKYVKDRKVLRFGITEDIPVGVQFGIDGGHIWKEYYQYNYLGAQGKFSIVTKSKVGWNIDLKTGLIRREGGQLEDKVFKLNTTAFSSLHNIGKFQHRAFFKFGYHSATKIVENTRTIIGNKYGVRGLQYLDTDGNQRITFSYDHVFFSPWYMAGFKFAPYVFSDIAFIAGRHVNERFSAYGLGFRLRNESLVIRTFHIRFAYHPQESTLQHNKFSFTFSLDDAPRFLDIRPNKPQRVSMN